MTLRITLGLALLVAAVAVATTLSGTWRSSSQPHQRSTQSTRPAASPDVFERAVNRLSVSPDAFERVARGAQVAVTMAPDFVDRPIGERSTAQPDQALDPAIAAAIRAHH
jgi:ABC-type uncharacterized transport system auxiliary subunit